MGRHRKLSIVTVVLAMVGAVFATAALATSEPSPIYAERGVLLLHTSDGGYKVQWFDAPVTLSGPATATQNISIDSKCNVTGIVDPPGSPNNPPGNPSLLTLTASGGTGVGAVSHGLGVKTKNNCSTEQGQIALLQSLTVSLGSAFNNTYFIESAELDIEGKRNAKLGVTYSPGGAIPAIMLGDTSDNGPDSGIGDNNIVTLSATVPFRSVTLSAVINGNSSPAVSLEGGGDGNKPGGTLRTLLATKASLFSLVQEFDGELNCGESTLGEGGGNDAEITVFRGGQADCDLKPYNDDALGATASFEPIGQDNAEFTATIVWPLEPADLPVLEVTQIDFGSGSMDVQWCEGTPDRNPDGTLAIETTEPFAFSGPPTTPAGASWCLLDQDVSYIGDDEMQITEYYYGKGDPLFAR